MALRYEKVDGLVEQVDGLILTTQSPGENPRPPEGVCISWVQLPR
jgi:hypothetical protein